MARIIVALLAALLLAGSSSQAFAQGSPNIPNGNMVVGLPTTDAVPAPPRISPFRFGHVDFALVQPWLLVSVPTWRTSNLRTAPMSNAVRERRAAGVR